MAPPQLLEQYATFDVAFIDGWRTFDHVLLHFLDLNRMIRGDGMTVFRDAHTPPIAKPLSHLSRYPSNKIASPLTVRHQLFPCFCGAVRYVLARRQKEIFSERMLTGTVQRRPLPTVVALQKNAEKDRLWNRYEPW